MSAAATPAGEPLIEMSGVSLAPASFVDFASVRDIHWQLRPGEYWVVGGLHWAGKSDWLATAAGLQRPAEGSLLLFGRDSATFNQDEFLAARLRLGLVFEDGGRLFPSLTVAQNVALPFCYHHNCPPAGAAEKVQELLDALGLTKIAALEVNRISRGWQQRAALARALVLEPEILLLDNPLAGLDPRHARWWLDFLDRLNAGDPAFGNRPIPLVVTTGDLRPWATRGRQFALLQDESWLNLGGRSELQGSSQPSLRELLALEEM